MKTIVYSTIFFFLIALYANAQSPQAISYQAVARDSSGNLFANHVISLRFSIRDLTTSGTIVYRETQNVTTNALGLFTANIGQGAVVNGTFSAINWGSGAKFVQVEMDTSGGITYINMGTQQLLSVPYALYSSGSVTNVSATTPLSSSGGLTPNLSLTGTIPVTNGGTGTAVSFTTGSVVFAGSGGNYNQNNSVFFWDNSTSRLGLGLSAPLERLHVSGNIRASSLSGVGPRMVQANSNGNLMPLAAGTANQVLLGTGVFGNVPTNTTWSLTGNSGTSDVTNFIGTTDNVPLNFRVNNQKSGRIDPVTFNTFFGFQSGMTNTTGSGNTALGFNSFYQNSTGNSNTAIGAAALASNTDGNFNTAVGAFSLVLNTTGILNCAFGYDALNSNTSGTTNTGIGANSMLNNTTGNTNSALGNNSLYANVTGNNNTAIGAYALGTNIIGSANTAIGSNALFSNLADFNTATGNSALQANTIGFGNTANGYGALYQNTTGNQNTASGYQAIFSNTTGTENTAYGASALFANIDGVQNTAVGSSALVNNTSGTENTAVGRNALYSNSTGSNNVAIGNNSLKSNYTGLFNTAIGHGSLFSNVNGQGNTATGSSALFANTTGLYNTAIGMNALQSNIIGTGNTAIGAIALASNLANNNTAVGYFTLTANSTGGFNTAHGSYALYSNGIGDQNTATGSDALKSNTSGSSNSGFGNGALFNNISGNNNTGIGIFSGYSNTTGSGNIFIGAQAGYFETGSNKLYIANSNTTTPLIYGDFSMGRIGIGTSAPNSTIHTIGRVFIDNSGNSHGLSGNPALTIDGASSEDILRLRDVGAGTAMVVNSAGNVGINTPSSPTRKLDVNGNARIGVNGTTITEVIKATVNSDVANVPAGTTIAHSFPVTNTSTTSSVMVSPSSALPDGLIIAYARISGSGFVEVKFTNITGTPIDLPAMDYYISVIR